MTLRYGFLPRFLALVNQFNHTSWVTAVTQTDRPKSVRNRCVIKVLAAFFIWSRCFLECSVGVGVFVTGLSQISSFFSSIPFSGFRREVENASAIQRPGGHLGFPIGPKNTNLVEDDHASRQVSLNSVQWFQKRSRKCLSQSEAGLPSWFSNRKEKQLVRGRWDLASRQVSLNSVRWFQRRSRKCLSQSEAGAAILVFDRPRKTQTCWWTLISFFLSSSVKFSSLVSEKRSKMSQPIRGRGGHLGFPIGPKNVKFDTGR